MNGYSELMSLGYIDLGKPKSGTPGLFIVTGQAKYQALIWFRCPGYVKLTSACDPTENQHLVSRYLVLTGVN